MIPITFLEGKSVVVFGLGASGLSAARALRLGGALPVLTDDKETAFEAARAEGFVCVPYQQIDWDLMFTLVLAPGVPLTHPEPHPVVRLAQVAGLDIVGDVELFFLQRELVEPKAPVVAITGTNGKSTTTALMAHVLKELGVPVAMGGNIGVPVLDLAPLGTGHTYVLELSSFQIDLTPSLHPTVGILLNISEDHLDRHGDMETYAGVKEMLIQGADFGVIASDDVWCQRILNRQASRGRDVMPVEPADFVDTLAGHPVLKGLHNAQNAISVFAAAWHLGYDPAAIRHALDCFTGLAHRLEPLGLVDGVLFINDSKATNADSAEKALQAYDDIFWIAGGKPKTGGIEALSPLFPRVRQAFLIGAAEDEFSQTLEASSVLTDRCGTLDVAVQQAFEAARESGLDRPVVLLSPACASFDQYRSFEARGEHFRSLFHALQQDVGGA